MTSPSDPRTSRLYHAAAGTAFTPAGAIALACAAAATMLVVGIGTHVLGAPLFQAVAAGQIAMASLVMVVALRVRGGPRTLGFSSPPARALVGAVLIGCTFWYLNLRIVSLVPLPEAELQPLQQLVEVPPLWLALVCVAFIPAFCEELVFRGMLVRSLVPRASHVVAIVLSAALFAGYHLSVVQLIPTFVLGVVFGHVALRSDSVLPTMVAHFLNNAIALSIARGELARFADALGAYPTVALTGAVVLGATGIALVSSRPTRA